MEENQASTAVEENGAQSATAEQSRRGARNKKKATRKSVAYNIAVTAMFVVVIAVCAWIAVPVNLIPITLQTMAVCLSAAMLGWKRGLFAVAAYLLLGLVGVPVFAGFGSTASLVGPTGGYLIGFLFTAVVVGFPADLVKGRFTKKRKWIEAVVLVVSMILGIAVCYVFGTAWFMVYRISNDSAVSLGAALALCVLPYIAPDLCKIAVATALAISLKRFVK